MKSKELNIFILELLYDEFKLEEFKYDFFWDNSAKDLVRLKYNLSYSNVSNIAKRLNLKVPQLIKNIKREQFVYAKYGVTNVSQLSWVSDKRKDTVRTRYDVDYVFQADFVKEESKATKLLNHNDENYNNMPKHRKTCLKKFGCEYFSQTDEWKEKTEFTKLVNHNDPHWNNRPKARLTCLKRYKVINPSQIPSVASRKCRKVSAKDGKLFDSKWEVYFYQFLLDAGITNISRNFSIKYTYNNEEHTTFIDFKVDNILFEVKGLHLLSGSYDLPNGVPISAKLKIYKDYDVIVITENTKILNDWGIRGLDIEIFKQQYSDLKIVWNSIVDYVLNHRSFLTKDKLDHILLK